MTDKAMRVALGLFTRAAQNCEDEKEVSDLAQSLAVVALKTIHGIEGRAFKRDFIKQAMKDNEVINTHRVN